MNVCMKIKPEPVPWYRSGVLMRIDGRGLRTEGQHKSLQYLSAFFLSGVIIFLLACINPTAARAQDALDQRIYLDIAPRTSLDEALIAWGTAVGVSVMIDTATVANKVTDGVHGTYSAREILSQLLRNSGLTYSMDGRIVRVTATSPMAHPRS